MTDNNTSSTQGVTPEVDSSVMDAPASSGVTPDAKPNVTLEEALARIAELEHSTKNARAAEDRLGKKLAAYEAELSEIERLRKQYAELQSQHDTYKQTVQARNIRYEVEKAANKLNIIDPDAAFRLLDLDELELDGDGVPTNADKLLEKLIKQRSYLAPEKQPEPTAPPETPASHPSRNNVPALPAMNPGRTQIAAPDSMPANTQISIQDAYRLARERR